jgi:diguanylate cyclase (GGDEF)-like protein/PAS domain S-box-containing protein
MMNIKQKWLLCLMLAFAIPFLSFATTKADEHIEWDLADIFENHRLVRLMIDVETQDIVFASQSASLYYGYSKEELLSMKISDINIMTPEEITRAIDRANSNQQNFFEMKHQLKNGDIRDVHVYSYPVEQDGRDYLYSTIIDVTDRVRAQRTIVLLQVVLGSTAVILIGVLGIFMHYLKKDKTSFEYLANHDILTGARSRLYFEHKTNELIIKRLNFEPFGFIMFDLDDFKHVNDMYGHVVGDQVLKYVVTELYRIMPDTHSIYRYGGDEFIIFMHAIDDNYDLDRDMKKYIASMKANSPFDFDIQISYGIEMIKTRNDLRDAIRKTDLKMYKMKHNNA